jgi:hypothetical protein
MSRALYVIVAVPVSAIWDAELPVRVKNPLGFLVEAGEDMNCAKPSIMRSTIKYQCKSPKLKYRRHATINEHRVTSNESQVSLNRTKPTMYLNVNTPLFQLTN